MITDAIRSADTENEVLILLTTYVETERVNGRFHFLPESATPLPLNDVPVVRTHVLNLLAELDAASRNLNDSTCEVLHTALHIYGTGLEQIIRLKRRRSARLAA